MRAGAGADESKSKSESVSVSERERRARVREEREPVRVPQGVTRAGAQERDRARAITIEQGVLVVRGRACSCRSRRAVERT